jgi:predicted dehydrogenase
MGPKTFHVEDSAFGFIKMENGATIFLESSWAFNTTDAREAMTSLCGTEGGAEMKGSPFLGNSELVFNSTKFGKLVETKSSMGGGIAYFGPGANADIRSDLYLIRNR